MEDRVSRIEGALPYLATKEDLARVETSIANLETRIEQIENRLFLKLTGVIILVGTVMTAIIRLL